jgi:thiamine-monophosphate kinase
VASAAGRGARQWRELDEFTVIERYFARPGGSRRGVVLGIGDDAAVTRLAAGYDLVIATDTLLEGTHFMADTPPRSVGHRSLAVNLSDLAAMGAEPLWATLALSLPVAEARWLAEFSRGFFRLARAFRVALVGGDTVRGPTGTTVTVHGQVRLGRFVGRHGARPGDAVYVTGHPGDAVAGRLLLDRSRLVSRGAGALIRKFLYPMPRVIEGRALVGLATAMIDVSDGLHDDASKLMRASGCGAELDAGAIALSAAIRRRFGTGAARHCALTGGDDYELLFTVAPRLEPQLHRRAAHWRCAVTRLGRVTARRGVRWRLDGRPFDVPPDTFRHF